MPRYAIISDQHFGVNGDSEFFHENYRLFYRNVFHPAIAEKRVDAVLIPGDLWQSRKAINPLSADLAFKEFFQPLAEAGVPVFIAYGNHDVYYKNTNKVNSIDFIGEMYDNVTVVPEFKVLDGGVSLVSWITDDNGEAIWGHIDSTDSRFLVGHFEIAGHMMTPGYACEHGIPKDRFKKFAKVISGHFHVRGNDGKIFYTSNPSQTTWADWGQEKGFHILDTGDGSLEPVNNPYEVYAVYAYADDSVFTPEDAKEYAGKIVKIVITAYQLHDPVKLKALITDMQAVAERVTVVETEKFDGTSELVVNGNVAAVSVKDVIVDYAKAESPAEHADAVVAHLETLYQKAAEKWTP